MREDRDFEVCARCGGHRERHVDRMTGRYRIVYPTRCDDKDRCETEIMAGFVVEKDSRP